MARKLQSDKWLFLATLALVCTSVVMVYSASALVALERFQQPYLFVTKQVMWALLGVAVMSIVMRIDYRTYRNERLIWTLLGDRRRCCSSPCCSRARSTARGAGSRSAASASSRPSWPRSRRSCSRAVDPRAAHAPRQRDELLAAADRHHHGRAGRPDPARAGLRHGRVAAGRDRADDLRRRAQLSLPGRRGSAGAAGALRDPDVGRLSPAPAARLPRSVGRSAWRRLPDHPVADCRRHRRRHSAAA